MTFHEVSGTFTIPEPGIHLILHARNPTDKISPTLEFDAEISRRLALRLDQTRPRPRPRSLAAESDPESALMPIGRRSFVRRTALAAAATGLGWSPGWSHARGPAGPLRVRVWSEGMARKSIYPDDVDGALADHFRRVPGVRVARARLDEPHAGLTDSALDATDALIWWGRLRHDDLPADRVRAVVERVKAGRLGFVALHASCGSKPFRELMGTSCEPGGWRDDGRPERIEIRAPKHPIARGVAPFTIPKAATFVEPFAVPEPESVVFVSSWGPGETFRSGLTWTIDRGRVAYLRPGHEAYPVLFHPSVRRTIANAAAWVARRV